MKGEAAALSAFTVSLLFYHASYDTYTFGGSWIGWCPLVVHWVVCVVIMATLTISLYRCRSLISQCTIIYVPSVVHAVLRYLFGDGRVFFSKGACVCWSI